MGRGYDPDIDYRQKINDLRKDWEMARARLVAERDAGYDDDGEEWDDDFSTEVSSYFEKTGGKTADEGGKGEKISGGSSLENEKY